MATFIQYYRALAASLDDIASVTASGGTGTTIVAPIFGDSTTGTSTSKYNDAWIYCVSGTGAGQQARAKFNSWSPSTSTLGVVNTITAPSNGDLFELTWLFPVNERQAPGSTTTGYRQLIARALGRLLVRDRINIALVSGQQSYSLATWAAWLDREDRIQKHESGPLAGQWKIWEPGPTGLAQVPAGWRDPMWRFDADLPYLDLHAPFSNAVTGNLSIDVLRPADTLLKPSGSGWVESTPGDGLTAGVDEARASINDVVTVALEEAYLDLVARAPGEPSGRNWADLLQTQRGLVRSLAMYDHTADTSGRQAPAGAAAA